MTQIEDAEVAAYWRKTWWRDSRRHRREQRQRHMWSGWSCMACGALWETWVALYHAGTETLCPCWKMRLPKRKEK